MERTQIFLAHGNFLCLRIQLLTRFRRIAFFGTVAKNFEEGFAGIENKKQNNFLLLEIMAAYSKM